jgi:hypothetical protein
MFKEKQNVSETYYIIDLKNTQFTKSVHDTDYFKLHKNKPFL